MNIRATLCLGRHRQRRDGAVLAAVLIGLGIASLMMTTMVRQALLGRKHLRLHQYQHQAGWLCEAGISQSVASIARNPQYSGGSWTIDSLAGDTEGTITVKVNHREQTIAVVAEYPAAHPWAVRQSRTVRFP